MSLQFNDTTNKNGLIQACESKVMGSNYGIISGNTETLQTFTRYLNNALNKFTTKVLNSDTRWQFDDTNRTDFPIGTTSMSDNVNNYELDVSHLKILAVEVKNSAGQWVTLDPVDITDMKLTGSISDFESTKGMPRFYDKLGTSIKLYPAPSSTETTLTNGLKVHYQREPSYFVYTDTTKLPGIPSIFHKNLVTYACHEYATDNLDTNKIQILDNQIQKEEMEVEEWYSKRDKDDKPRLTRKIISYK